MANDDDTPPTQPAAAALTPAQVAATAAANAAARAVSNRCKARPREYLDGENFDTYLNHFNRMALANNWSDEVKLVQLETLLKGKAQKQFEMFIEEDPGISWDEMTDNLKKEMRPTAQQSVDTFSQMRLDSKSPKEFYAALVRQSRIAHGEMNDEARHVVVRAQMLQVLPKQLRTDASKQEDLSVLNKENLLALLTRVYEADWKDNAADEAKYEPGVFKVQDSASKSMDTRLQNLEKEMSELKTLIKGNMSSEPRQSRGRYIGQPQRTDPVICFKCQKTGHFARNCRNAPACRFCKQVGHRPAECPNNQEPKNY